MIDNKIKLEIEEILKVLLEQRHKKQIQMFNCYDWLGDYKVTLYHKCGIEVLYAPYYDYVELIGLDEEDYKYFLDKYGY